MYFLKKKKKNYKNVECLVEIFFAIFFLKKKSLVKTQKSYNSISINVHSSNLSSSLYLLNYKK